VKCNTIASSIPTVILTLLWYTVPTNEAVMTEVQWYSSCIMNEGNAIQKHACPEAKGSNPTTGLNLLWACSPFRGNSNYWQVSREGSGRVIPKRRLGNEKGTTI